MKQEIALDRGNFCRVCPRIGRLKTLILWVRDAQLRNSRLGKPAFLHPEGARPETWMRKQRRGEIVRNEPQSQVCSYGN